MMNRILKYLIITTIAVGLIHHNCFSQDFFRDYANHLQNLNHATNWTNRDKEQIAKQHTDLLRKVFNEVGQKEKVFMLRTDTLYIANYSASNGFTSQLIWNINHSCYYECDNVGEHHRLKIYNLVIKTNASKLLVGIDPESKKLIQRADTLDFNKIIVQSYNNILSKTNYTTPVKDYTTPVTGFTVAIKKKKHWYFISSKNYPVIIDG